MSNFFKKFMNGGTVSPPQGIEKEFYKKFSDPLNVEWFLYEGQFEAVFYKENREYIARYNAEGALIDYRINLPAEELSEAIRSNLDTNEEIMNVVAVVTDRKLEYEIIVRDKMLKRYVLQLTSSGKVMQRKAL
jgi:hypothetical protein